MHFETLDLARTPMYFSIRKTFSRFRSLSDASSSTDYVSPAPSRRRSSMSKIEELFNTACSFREKPLSHARVSSDSGILSPRAATVGFTPRLFPILPPLPGAPPHESSQSKTEQLLQALLRENKILRNENSYLKIEAQVREEELAKFRSEYYTEKFNAAVRKHILGSERCGTSDPKPFPSKSFRPPLKLHRPVETSVGEADPRKGATVGVLQSAAVLVSSPKTIPTMSVTRTNDCLEAMTPRSRRSRTTQATNDTNTRARRAIKAHEPTKKVSLSSADSDRSGISILGYGERKMDDLLKQLKTGSATLAPTTAARITNSTVGSTPRSISYIPVAHSRGRNLAPLASEIFKDEVKDSLSPGKRSPAKKLRSVLNEVDINRTSPHVGSCGAKQSIECSGTSAKALGKRKAILLSLDSAIDVRSKFASDKSHFRNNGTIESHHLPPLMLETSTSRFVEDSGALSAEKALLSLERICAGFSSGSLGSLESTSDPSSVIDPLVDVPSLFVVDTTVEADKLLSVRSRASSGPESPSFSRLSVKTSTPLVSRYRSSILSSPFRPAATFSPKATLRSTTTPRKCPSPLRLTKVTSAISSSPSPTKKTICKTSPLRITKKGKGSVSVRPSPEAVTMSLVH